MPNENRDSENGGRSTSNCTATWIALLTALGVTATAFVIAKRVRGSTVKAHVEDLVHLCDRAAKTLDERLGHGEMAFASN
jgi:hypothetical protein